MRITALSFGHAYDHFVHIIRISRFQIRFNDVYDVYTPLGIMCMYIPPLGGYTHFPYDILILS